ncbi:MAG: DUF3836 domain-containing protein [Tannerellaceae bacterium]|nr:DUF3836 domain-containing protein [Tannerellaceae bacterium]
MKKLIIAVRRVCIVAIVCVVSGKGMTSVSSPEFLYNVVFEDERTVVKQVCKKVKDGYILHIQKEYTYDINGNPECLLISRWNKETYSWEKSHRIVYIKDEIMNTQK